MRKTDAHIKKRKDFSTVMHNIAATYLAKEGNPVAVVYYRCELQGTKSTAHDHLYYVHNGVALEDLPNKTTNIVQISHVATWPHTNKVYIFGESDAAQAVKDGKGKTCCGSEEEKIGDKTWRPWIWVAILPYSENHQPIAWMVDNNPKDPHNGVLYHLDCPKEECTLHYWHFKNTKVEGMKENPRTVYDDSKDGHVWKEKFVIPGRQLEYETVKASQKDKNSLTIATQPPVTKPCWLLMSYPAKSGGLTIEPQPPVPVTNLPPCPQ